MNIKTLPNRNSKVSPLLSPLKRLLLMKLTKIMERHLKCTTKIPCDGVVIVNRDGLQMKQN